MFATGEISSFGEFLRPVSRRIATHAYREMILLDEKGSSSTRQGFYSSIGSKSSRNWAKKFPQTKKFPRLQTPFNVACKIGTKPEFITVDVIFSTSRLTSPQKSPGAGAKRGIRPRGKLVETQSLPRPIARALSLGIR